MLVISLISIMVLLLVAWEELSGGISDGTGTQGYKEHTGHCVNSEGRDVDELYVPNIESLHDCKAYCAHASKCLAEEWYSKS
mmetsp:Transcript_65125/g.119910  ORF Transcript_65125/g.119910 Transcript_65125/m.119910 type:complete len:82 (-) Transcript_65125:2-247(-)